MPVYLRYSSSCVVLLWRTDLAISALQIMFYFTLCNFTFEHSLSNMRLQCYVHGSFLLQRCVLFSNVRLIEESLRSLQV